jgi:fatty acid desaturase
MDPVAIPLAQWKQTIKEFFRPNPAVYWTDFLLSTFLGYGALALFLSSTMPWSLRSLAFGLCVFALYRAGLFVHELTHRERHELPGFSLTWNLLVGIPFLVPSFMYRGVHLDHHKGPTYGTNEDGEYLAMGAMPLLRTLVYTGHALLIPLLLLLRFGLVGPISFLHPGLRKKVMLAASSFAIRYDVERKLPAAQEQKRWLVQELLCTLFAWFLVFGGISGFLSWSGLGLYYAALAVIHFLNSIRTVVAHRYLNRSGHAMSFSQQLGDSVNLEGNWLFGELMAPVGLRFHGLHHLFPNLPYHNLSKAHFKLKESLPSGSPYFATIEPGIGAALVTHWRNTRDSSLSTEKLATPERP